ncbi:MAG: hypothetical protein ABIQ36_06190, partial [Rhodanobacter sp.]
MIKPLTAAISSILLFSAISTRATAQDATPAGNAATDATKQDTKKKDDKVVDLNRIVVTGTRSP